MALTWSRSGISRGEVFTGGSSAVYGSTYFAPQVQMRPCRDKAMLKELIQKGIVFIGMLGPIKKLERIINELKEEGLELNEQQRAVIHSPVGLDIGAETPEEIALSIVAEIKAALSDKRGNPLKEFTTTIHSREATIIEEVRLTSGS